MKQFAEELNPVCGPAHVQLCDAETQRLIDEYREMGADARTAAIKKDEEDVDVNDKAFLTSVDGLSAYFKVVTKLNNEVREAQAELKLLKSVHGFSKRAAKGEL